MIKIILISTLLLMGCTKDPLYNQSIVTFKSQSKSLNQMSIKYNEDTGDTYITEKNVTVYIDEKIISKLKKKELDSIYNNLLDTLINKSLIKTALYFTNENIVYLILSEVDKKPTIGIQRMVTNLNNKKLKEIMIIKFLKLLKIYKEGEK